MHPQYTTAAQARVLSVPGSHLVLTAITVGGVTDTDSYRDIQRSIDSAGKIPRAPRYYSITCEGTHWPRRSSSFSHNEQLSLPAGDCETDHSALPRARQYRALSFRGALYWHRTTYPA